MHELIKATAKTIKKHLDISEARFGGDYVLWKVHKLRYIKPTTLDIIVPKELIYKTSQKVSTILERFQQHNLGIKVFDLYPHVTCEGHTTFLVQYWFYKEVVKINIRQSSSKVNKKGNYASMGECIGICLNDYLNPKVPIPCISTFNTVISFLLKESISRNYVDTFFMLGDKDYREINRSNRYGITDWIYDIQELSGIDIIDRHYISEDSVDVLETFLKGYNTTSTDEDFWNYKTRHWERRQEHEVIR